MRSYQDSVHPGIDSQSAVYLGFGSVVVVASLSRPGTRPERSTIPRIIAAIGYPTGSPKNRSSRTAYNHFGTAEEHFRNDIAIQYRNTLFKIRTTPVSSFNFPQIAECNFFLSNSVLCTKSTRIRRRIVSISSKIF